MPIYPEDAKMLAPDRYVGTAAESCRPAGSLHHAIETLREIAAKNSTALDELASRLSPVLREQMNGRAATDMQVPFGGDSPATERLRDVCYKLQQQSDQIRAIEERLVV